MPALMWAADRGHTDVVAALTKAGAALDIRSNKGNTALINAAIKGHAAVATLLIKAGAALDVQDNAGCIA